MAIAKIRDVLGIEMADIALEPNKISVLIGKNFNGKSSAIKVIGGILSNNKMPNGHPQTEAISMVRTGREEGSVTLVDGSGSIMAGMTWRKGGVKQEGEVKAIQPSAAGFLTLSGLEPEKRAIELIKIIGASPTEKDLKVAIADKFGKRPMSDEKFTDLWQRIKTLGWTSVQKSEEEKQRIAKARWCAQTGKQKWLINQADWSPEGYDAQQTIEALTAKIQALNAERDQAQSNRAVDADRNSRLAEKAAKIPDLEERIKVLQEQRDTIALTLNSAKALMHATPPPAAAEDVHPCPHCQKDITIRGNKPYAPQALDPKQRAKQQSEHDSAKRKVDEIGQAVSVADRTLGELGAELKQAKAASDELKQAKAAKPVVATRSLDEIDQDLRSAIRAQENIKSKELAHKLYLEAEDQISLVELISPDGLQQRKLAERLGEFNDKHLRPLTEAAGWQQIRIQPDMSIIYDSPDGGLKEFRDLSESEQWRTDAVLQIAIAQIQGDQFVLMDRAELLDAQGCGELFKLLSTKRIGAVIAMKANKPTDCPNLAAKGLGQTYFVEKGKVVAVGELVTA